MNKKYRYVLLALVITVTVAVLYFLSRSKEGSVAAEIYPPLVELTETSAVAPGATVTEEVSGESLLPDRSRFKGLQLKDAQALIDARNFDEAIELLQYQLEVFTKPVKRARVQLLLAKLLVGQGYLDEALALFKAAALSGALPPMEGFDAYVDVIRTLTKLGMLDEATAWVDRVVAEYLADDSKKREWFYPNTARLNLGRSLFNLGLYDIAIAQLDFMSGPDSLESREAALIQARAMISMGQTEGAIAVLLKGIGESGGEPYTAVSKLYHEWVKLVLGGGDPEEALRVASAGARVFEGSKKYEDYMFFMSALLRKNGIDGWKDFALAAAYGDNDRRREKALQQLATSSAREGNWEDAEKYYQELLTLPNSSDIEIASNYLNLMNTQVKLGKSVQPVVDSLMAFLETTDATDVAALHRIGKGLLEAGYYTEAEAYFQRVADASGDDVDQLDRAMLLLGDARAANGDVFGAKEAYVRVIESMRQQGLYDMVAQTMYREAEKMDRLKFPDEKEKLIARIEEELKRINNPQALLDMLDYFGARNEYDLPRKALDLASEMYFSRSVEVSWKTQARLLLNLYAFKKNDEASRMIDNILNGHDSVLSPGFLAQKAQFYDALISLRNNDKEAFLVKADRLLSDAAVNDVPSAEYALSFGESMYFDGDKQKALEFFNKSVASAPGSTHAMQSRIYLGVDAYERGDFETAQICADAIIQNMSPESPIDLFRSVYWGGVFLKGLILNVSERGSGASRIVSAKSHEADLWAPLNGY